MRTTCIVAMLALTVAAVGVAAAWQRPNTDPLPVAPHMPRAQAYSASPSLEPTPEGWPATPPPAQPYTSSEDQSRTQTGFPQYPYPQYHNPFFNESASGNFFSAAMDWLLSLPQSVLDRTTSYIDGTFFPQAPATHGQAGQSGSALDAREKSAAQRQPLPPAQRYVPQPRN